jgi:hypothetical protein
VEVRRIGVWMITVAAHRDTTLLVMRARGNESRSEPCCGKKKREIEVSERRHVRTKVVKSNNFGFHNWHSTSCKRDFIGNMLKLISFHVRSEWS